MMTVSSPDLVNSLEKEAIWLTSAVPKASFINRSTCHAHEVVLMLNLVPQLLTSFVTAYASVG